MNDGVTWSERELVPISALEHYCYCPRQCALIHVEQTYEENLYTLRGKAGHERVDEAITRTEGEVRVERALPIWSDRLGLVGRADAVEFHPPGPFPIEYKQGPRLRREHDDVQLCAQALCLEEMFSCPVPEGAVYHITSRQRRTVTFTPELRIRVQEVVAAVRLMLLELTVPPPVNDNRCPNCSLVDSCLPGTVADRKRMRELERHTLAVDTEG